MLARASMLSYLLISSGVAMASIAAVDWSSTVRISATTTTCQVVTNPILDRTLVAPNGTTFTNPIHDRAWQSLAALEADLVRFVPWFPYPEKSVAELVAPNVSTKTTSWNFDLVRPQLEDFMDATYAQNHTTVVNFATQPCWLFGDAENKTQACPFPANADEVDFTYITGDRKNLLDPSAGDLADYYARLLAWLVHGRFEDEYGVEHTGGPKYAKFDRAHGHVWELFNEGGTEHKYNPAYYIHDWDVVVNKMIAAVGGIEHAPLFMGVAAQYNTSYWWGPFLNASLHSAEYPAADYVSAHFYAQGDDTLKRTDPSTYGALFTSTKSGFLDKVEAYVALRNASSMPHVKLDFNELGCIMPDDNNATYNITADLPDLYWNAAAAQFAYVFAFTAPLGVEVIGMSQLAGSPKIPEWGIPAPQFPSVTMLDWRTGLGTARYWVLKLLIEEFAPGDRIVPSEVTMTSSPSTSRAHGDIGVVAYAAVSGRDGGKRVLLVNTRFEAEIVELPGATSLRVVDASTVTRGSAHGIVDAKVAASTIHLAAFAVVVVHVEI